MPLDMTIAEKRKRLKKKMVAAVACMALLMPILHLVQNQPHLFPPKLQRCRKGRLVKTRASFDSVSSYYSDKFYRKAYRMTRRTFQKLLSLLKPDLERNESMARRSGYPTIEPALRLGVTLRLLAGASYLDLMPLYDLPSPTIYQVFHSTCDAINLHLSLPGLPTTIEGLRASAEDFTLSRSPASPLTGCVGALDGIAVKIKKPRDELNSASYWCRKHYHAIPVQAMVDSNYRFLSFSAKCVGSTHDSLAHAVSGLGRYLKEERFEYSFWIAGDEAYICAEYLITPYPASQITQWKDSFNFWQSSLRMHVEQAFGRLVAKWRILDNLSFTVETNIRVVCVAMKLHNFILDEETDTLAALHKTNYYDLNRVVLQSEEWYKIAKQDMREVQMQNRPASTPASISKLRDKMLQVVKGKGLLRPVTIAPHMPIYDE